MRFKTTTNAADKNKEIFHLVLTLLELEYGIFYFLLKMV